MLEPSEETLAALSRHEPLFDEVKTIMTQLSASQRARMLADLREKRVRDEGQLLHDAREEGIEIGVQKGLQKGLQKGRHELLQAKTSHLLAKRMGSKAEPFLAQLADLSEPALSELFDLLVDTTDPSVIAQWFETRATRSPKPDSATA